MEQFALYRFNPHNKVYVEDHKTLPIITPDRGYIYRGYEWSCEKDNYSCTGTAMYNGDGNWIDPDTKKDVESIVWSDYIEKVY